MKTVVLVLSIALMLLSAVAIAGPDYSRWQHSGSIYLLTTPDGANLPTAARIKDFPVLVRFSKGSFDFSQALDHGQDIRFATSDGAPLPYQVELWDASQGQAAIWVRVPEIQGNAHQQLRVYWGNASAKSESNGPAVFNADNGFVTVMHMDEALKDDVGTIKPEDNGTTPASGIIGSARHIKEGKGIGCDHIKGYPHGDMPFTSEAWFRAEKADCSIFAWGRYATRLNGKTGDGNEVDLLIGSPPRLHWASDGPGGAGAKESPVLGEWHHMAAMYEDGTSKLYVDGKLEGTEHHKAAMSIMDDVYFYIGGLRHTYNYAGDVDEVRVSSVARSADWMKLEFENQKAGQSLVGGLVKPGSAFSVTPAEVMIDEGKSATLTAEAGGAEKVYWVIQRDGVETIAAIDQLSYTLDAGRVVGDTKFTLQFKAVYATETKARQIPVTVREDIPEPVVTLKAPAAWNGRDTIEVVPQVRNLAAMQGKGAGTLKYRWSIIGGAVTKEVAADKLILTRSQYTGPITVKLALSNGGAETVAATGIQVTEPATDAWVERIPDKDEKPEDNQFYARNDKNEGTLYYNGTLDKAAEGVFLKVYADGQPYKTESQKLADGKSYALKVNLKPGLIKYKVEFGTQAVGSETVERTVNNIVCGDAYIIDGQSNAEATGPNNGPNEDAPTKFNDFIRSFGNQHDGNLHGGWGNAIRTHIWGHADYGDRQIGTWGMVLAEDLVEKYKIPICIINGSYGGTPIYLHQRNPANHFDTSGEFYKNPYKIYGGILSRVTAAHLTHGIRGVFWHQGENDQGSGAPTGDYNYKSYQQYFVEMASCWKQDFPNIQHYYVWQIWPSACSMGGTHASDMLLDVQRTLPTLFSNMRVMSTMGIVSKGTGRGMCHYDMEGYAQVARLMLPLVEQDNYGLALPQPMTSPNLRSAWFTSPAHNSIALDFGQPMQWKDEMKRYIYLDNVAAQITGGSATGNVITLELSAPSDAKLLAYLASRDWDGTPKQLIYGANGVAALSFCDVPVGQAETPARRP